MVECKHGNIYCDLVECGGDAITYEEYLREIKSFNNKSQSDEETAKFAAWLRSTYHIL